MKRIILFLLMLMLFTSFLHGLEKFYNKGLEYMEKGDWLRAIEEFKSAASLEFEDTKKMRTYGTRFIKYFPHREMGIAYYQLGELSRAKDELELSLAYKKSKEAEEYLEKVLLGIPPEQDVVLQEKIIEEVIEEKPEVVVDEPKKKEEVEEEPVHVASVDKEIIKQKPIVQKPIIPTKKKEDEKVTLEPSTDKVPVGALTYDPSKVTQVGSRLSIAVRPAIRDKRTGTAI